MNDTTRIPNLSPQMNVEYTGTVDGAERYKVTDTTTDSVYSVECRSGQWSVCGDDGLVGEDTNIWWGVVIACTDDGQEAQA